MHIRRNTQAHTSTQTSVKYTPFIIILMFISIAKKRPSLRDINRYVLKKYAVHWEAIGASLEVKNLDLIKRNNQGHDLFNEDCFSTMLKRWDEYDIDATWEKLANAINEATGLGKGATEKGMLHE